MCFRRKTSDEIRQLTDDSMAGLVSIWMELFDSDIVRQNLVKLVGHVNQFYQEICEETAQRKETIQKKIESEYFWNICSITHVFTIR